MTWGTALTILVLVAIVVLIIRSMLKDKREGKSTCGGECAHCGGACHVAGHTEQCHIHRKEQ